MPKSIDANIHCGWAFQCPKTWQSLSPTGVSNVRHCDACNKDVTLALSRTHLNALTKAGACVAVISTPQDERSKMPVMRIGLRMSDKLRSFTDDM